MVSTYLKNISQIGSSPQLAQLGVKIINIWNHHLVISFQHKFLGLESQRGQDLGRIYKNSRDGKLNWKDVTCFLNSMIFSDFLELQNSKTPNITTCCWLNSDKKKNDCCLLLQIDSSAISVTNSVFWGRSCNINPEFQPLDLQSWAETAVLSDPTPVLGSSIRMLGAGKSCRDLCFSGLSERWLEDIQNTTTNYKGEQPTT